VVLCDVAVLEAVDPVVAEGDAMDGPHGRVSAGLSDDARSEALTEAAVERRLTTVATAQDPHELVQHLQPPVP
jgi:hypothetical protein